MEKERSQIIKSLIEQEITPEQEQTLIDFSRKKGKGFEAADTDFMVRRAVIEALDVTATLTFLDGQKTLQAKCALGENIFVLSSVIPIQVNDNQKFETHVISNMKSYFDGLSQYSIIKKEIINVKRSHYWKSENYSDGCSVIGLDARRRLFPSEGCQGSNR